MHQYIPDSSAVVVFMLQNSGVSSLVDKFNAKDMALGKLTVLDHHDERG